MDTWKKYWISPDGDLIELALGDHHSYYAKRHFEKEGVEVNFTEAQTMFEDAGWLRVQVKQDSVAFEGPEINIVKYGDLVFDFKPDFQELIFSFTDTGRFKRIFRNQVEGWSWDSIVKEAKKGLIG